jgi:signal transduction histidine kinase
VHRREVLAPIRVRVTAVAALAVLLAALLGSLLFLRVLHTSLEAGLVSTNEQSIADIRAQLRDGASPAEVVATGDRDVVVQLLDSGGRVLAGPGARGGRPPLTSEVGVRQDVRVAGYGDHFTLVARRTTGTGPVALVVAGRSTEQVNRATRTALGLLGVAVPLVVLLLSLTVWVSIGRALRPVEGMRREADAITSARLDRRLPLPAGHDEIHRLATTINEMLDRIQRSDRLQRQFVSDASHELRSPLAVIRQSAEVARAYPDRVAQGALADDVLAESRRLEDLVGALLMLARLDDSRAVISAEPVDLDDLVLAEAGRVRDLPHLKVEVSHVSSGQVSGAAILLRQVVRNLVDNAARHATSWVGLSLQENDGWVELTVEDDGDGIPVPDRDRVFERFVRLDSARAREEGGAGLGLAIVRNIVETAHGTVRVDDSPAGGARFTVRLPSAG